MENRWRQAGTPRFTSKTRPKPARLSWSGGDPFGEGFEGFRDTSRPDSVGMAMGGNEFKHCASSDLIVNEDSIRRLTKIIHQQ